VRSIALVTLCLCSIGAAYPGNAQTAGPDGCATASQNATAYISFGAKLANHLRELCAAGTFSGAVLVIHNGKQIFAGAYGLADRGRGIPNSLSTRFRLGSNNKMFTAIAILQLAEEGKIQLDDPVGRYVQDYPNNEVASKVTLRELLNHTGGTGDIFGPEFEAHRLELRSLADYERLNGSRGPAFPPGSKFAYSNYGYILLGLVIESVSRQSYYDYVQRHIFRVAGMNKTGSEPEDVIVPGRAMGYTKRAGGSGDWESASTTFPYRGTSAGGGYSTVSDLLHFTIALSKNRLLSRQSMDVLTTAKVNMDYPGFRYACGFMETFLDGVRWIGHNGGAPGQNAEYWMAPATNSAVIVLSNLDPPSATAVARWIATRIPH
jgi:CubicO group peptidase (beta-lactamase class C family)